MIPKTRKLKLKLKNKWTEPFLRSKKDMEIIHHNMGNTLMKTKNNPKPNTSFHCIFQEDESDLLLSLLKLDNQNLKTCIILFIKAYWDIFHPNGVKVPIQKYKMEINTGDHKPI